MIVALFFIAVIHKKWRRIKGSKCGYLGFLGSRDFSSANFLSVEMSRKPIPLTEFRQRSTRKKRKEKKDDEDSPYSFLFPDEQWERNIGIKCWHVVKR